MREATVFYKNERAGKISQLDDGSFVFQYDNAWFKETAKPAISLTLPKTCQKYTLNHLFPFFFNMLPEGSNKQTVCFQNRLDLDDHFGILLITAENDTIGAVQVKKMKD